MLGLIWGEQKQVERCVSLCPAGSWNQLGPRGAGPGEGIPCLGSYNPANQRVQQLVRSDLICSSLKTSEWVLCACRNSQICTLLCRCLGSALFNMLLEEKLTMACAVVLLLLLSSLRTVLGKCAGFALTLWQKLWCAAFKVLANFFPSFSCPRNKTKQKESGKFKGARIKGRKGGKV